MKKFLYIVIAALMFAVNANGQYVNARIGFNGVLDPSPVNLNFMGVSTFGGQYGLSLSVGHQSSNNIYLGLGLDIAGYTLITSSNQSIYTYSHSESTTEFMMPVYGEIAYIKPCSWYGSFKIGPVFECYGSDVETDFYMNVVPIGYTFNSYVSCGIGYRLIGGHGCTQHGMSVDLRLNF